MQRLALLLIRLYKITLSPFLGSQCKFYPTCSEYASLAIKKYGFFRGILKSVVRMFRCNPFSDGGVDFP